MYIYTIRVLNHINKLIENEGPSPAVKKSHICTCYEVIFVT